MAKQRNPEQRSATGTPSPGPTGAIPTGDEVYETSRPGSEPAGPLTEQPQPTEQTPEHYLEESLAELRATASEYYEKLGETAAQLSEQASTVYDTGRGYVREYPGSSLLGAFAVGVLLGLLTGRD